MFYPQTTSLCPSCAKDTPAHYEAAPLGVFLIGECPKHGIFKERAEKDLDFFRWGYEQEYEKPHTHLVLPVTYRCNLKCKYCYTRSNTDLVIPDRPFDVLMGMLGSFTGNVTLIGGEPTIREDIFEIIVEAKKMPNIGKVSIATNGQRLRDMGYVRRLKESGIDFIFFSFNDVEYDMAAKVYINKLHALGNCHKLRMPVWLQGTISALHQLDIIIPVIREFKKIIFNITLRSVKPFGVNHPTEEIFVSDILEHLSKKDAFRKGTNPFNRFIQLEGRETKICSWVPDMRRIDPIDSDYVISDDTYTKFHRGMRMDDVLLHKKLFRKNTDGIPV